MVVVDSSVLIHLSRINKLKLLDQFFSKAGKVRITQEVYDEVKEGKGASEILEACKSWIAVSGRQAGEAGKLSEVEGIEKADASVILHAKKEADILLCNDYALMMVARSKGVECWWLTTFLLRCLQKKIISKNEAKQTLFELVESGMRLSNEVYSAILKEIENL